MKTNTINKQSVNGKIALLIIAIFLSLNLVKGQKEYLSLVVKVNCLNESGSYTSQLTYTDNLNTIKPNNDKEPSAEIEKWMYDLKLWVNMQVEVEAEIEDWMLNTNLWGKNISNNNDTELEIEDWMSNTYFWDNTISENELKIESWMSATDFWKN